MDLTMLEPGANDLQVVCSTEFQHVVTIVGGGGKGGRLWYNDVVKTDTT